MKTVSELKATIAGIEKKLNQAKSVWEFVGIASVLESYREELTKLEERK